MGNTRTLQQNHNTTCWVHKVHMIGKIAGANSQIWCRGKLRLWWEPTLCHICPAWLPSEEPSGGRERERERERESSISIRIFSELDNLHTVPREERSRWVEGDMWRKREEKGLMEYTVRSWILKTTPQQGSGHLTNQPITCWHLISGSGKPY